MEFRYIGYNSVEQKVKDKSVINIAMAESNVNLDDVVVIGYGSQKKESVVSSVNTMKPAEIAIPTRSLSNTIAGQVAGVIAIQRSGEPGNDDADFGFVVKVHTQVVRVHWCWWMVFLVA